MRWEIGDGNPNSFLYLRAVYLCVGGVFMRPPELAPIFLGTFFFSFFFFLLRILIGFWVRELRIGDLVFFLEVKCFGVSYFKVGFHIGVFFISGRSRIFSYVRTIDFFVFLGCMILGFKNFLSWKVHSPIVMSGFVSAHI